jgi:hypothetical protein
MISKRLPRTNIRFAPALIVAALLVVAVFGASAANLSFFGKADNKDVSPPKTVLGPGQRAPGNLYSPLASTLNSLSATVATDKADYAPGETVVISGSGWAPNEAVTLVITESDGDAPWNGSATADGSGNISNSDFAIQTHDLGVIFSLTATQGSASATATFTDSVVLTTGDPGGFEIDGNLRASTSPSPITDWSDTTSSSGVGGLLNEDGTPRTIANKPTYSPPEGVDGMDGDLNVFTGSNKADEDPTNPASPWTWGPGASNTKTEIDHVYVHVSKNGSDVWLLASGDRESTNGNSYIDFELFQRTFALTGTTSGGFAVGPCPTGKICGGGRTVGDLRFTVGYGGGGANPSIDVQQWTQTSPGVFAYVSFSPPAGSASLIVNSGSVEVPYTAFGSSTYVANQFAEMAVNLTAILGAASDPCAGIQVQTVFAKTRTSTAASSNLEDFVTPIPVSFSAGFTASAAVTNPSCSGGTGTITVTNTGGTAPLTYSKDGGATYQSSNIFSGLAAGNYTIKVKDASTCTTDSNSVTVAIPSAITASAAGTNPGCSTGLGSITTTASGGTGTLTYSIDGTNYQASNVFSGLAAGNYTITVKDASGCTTTTNSAAIDIPTAVDCTLHQLSDSSCGSDVRFQAQPTGGAGGYTFNWTVTGGTITDTSTTVYENDTITISTGADVIVSVLVTDANGCSHTCSTSYACEGLPFDKTLTQGAYGNKKGQTIVEQGGVCTLVNREQLITMLLTSDLVIGVTGEKSLTFSSATPAKMAQCIIKRLPAGTTPKQLFGSLAGPLDETVTASCDTSPDSGLIEMHTNKNCTLDNSCKWENVLLGQVIALSLNLRLDNLGEGNLKNTLLSRYMLAKNPVVTYDENGCPTYDSSGPECGDALSQAAIPPTVLTEIRTMSGNHGGTVADLLALANRALAGEITDSSLGEINQAVDALNQLFDEGKFLKNQRDDPQFVIDPCP